MRGSIIALYVVVFWGLLPALLVGSSWWLDARFGLSFSPPPAARAVGALAALGSALLLAVSIAQYSRGARSLPISAFPSAALVQNGLYGIWRHPIYLFYSLGFAGAGLAAGSGALLAVVLPVFLLGVGAYVTIEEKALLRRFGPLAAGYRERTGLVIPRLSLLLKLPGRIAARSFCDFELRNPQLIPRSGPFFLIAAHRCYLDPAFVQLAVPSPVRFVTTFEMYRGRLRSWLFQRLFCIPRRRYATDLGAIAAVHRAIREGWPVALFLEGERSWTGALQPLKPGAVRLLQRFPDVPVVPLRIDGNGLLWPRWRDKPLHAPVRVTVGPPMHMNPADSLEDACLRLSESIRPDDTGLRCDSPGRAAGIGRLLYACPCCGGRLPLLLDARERFACPHCGADFELTPTNHLRFSVDGQAVEESLARAHDRARARLQQSRPTGAADLPFDVQAYSSKRPEEPVTAWDRDVELFHERQGVLRSADVGTIVLDSMRLAWVREDESEEWPLAGISSATTERNTDLQLHFASRQYLVQLRFARQSVLRWQDLITAAVLRNTGRSPNRS